MHLWDALRMAFAMFWEILWALILGFGISAAVQAVVTKKEMTRLLPDASPGTLLKALGMGAASSSCSYAAVAITRSLIRKGADFTAAMGFQFASTNLVIELGIILALLIGWPFTAATWLGGVLMVYLLALLFKWFLRPRLVEEAKRQADQGVKGAMEGHAQMDMAVTEGSLWQRLSSDRGRTAISHYFVMDVVSVWKDIAGGLLIAGALSAWVPKSFWQTFFLVHHGTLLPKLWGAAVGPLVSVVSFVCSVGNVPMAAVLWNGGISFGGVIAFIFADLIVIPILNIYRKYYGWRMMAFLFATSYAAMVLSALVIEALFYALHLVPAKHHARIAEASIQWNYTTFLNLAFALVALLLVVRFFRTGGPEMLRMMDEMPGEHESRGHPGPQRSRPRTTA